MMTRADWGLVLALCALLPALYWQLWQPERFSQEAVVRADGEAPRLVPLHPDRHLTVSGPLGNSRLEIRGGRIRFLSSPCRQQRCIQRGWLKSPGEVAACLPNRISVQIPGRNPRFDAMNF